MICKICKKEYSSGKLMLHIKKVHNIDPQQYYNQFIKKEKEMKLCPICGKERKFNNLINGYYKTCGSKSCSSKLSNIIGKEKHQLSCIKRNQKWKTEVDENTGLNKQQLIIQKGKEKRKLKQKEISIKQSISMINHGNQKLKNTMEQRYNVSNAMHIDYIKEKVHETNQQKINQTIEKMKRTMIKKYGVDNFSKSEIKKEQQQNYYKQLMKERIQIYFKNNNLEILSNLDDYINEKTILKFKCKLCNNTYTKKWNSIQQYFYCKKCNPMNSTSSQEIEIRNFLEYYNIKYKHDVQDIIYNPITKRPYKFDFYIPDLNIMIEFNGLYWHCNYHKEDPKYHLKRTELCEEKGIKLIQIFEDEWYYKKDIVKSRLKNILNIKDDQTIIYARKCKVKEITTTIKSNFLDKNHLQGKYGSIYQLGLFYENELVSIMTFSHGNKTKGYKKKELEFEMSRFCSKLNTRIIGGMSKLLAYFCNNYKWNIIYTYADRRWSSSLDNSYQKNNFEFVNYTEPNYYYILLSKSLKRMSRSNFQKHMLKNKLENFDPNLTEQQNMLNNKYYIIYDCGNIKYQLIRRFNGTN